MCGIVGYLGKKNTKEILINNSSAKNTFRWTKRA